MDDKSNSGAVDRSRINLNQDYEVPYWTRALGVSKEGLQALVQEVGNSADTIRARLKQGAPKHT